MARFVYSALFFVGNINSTLETLFTVPDNETWVLREMVGTVGTSFPLFDPKIYLYEPGPGVQWSPFDFGRPIFGQKSLEWTGRQVYTPGMSLQARTVGESSAGLRLSGYILEGVRP